MATEKPNFDELKISDDIIAMSKVIKKEFVAGDGGVFTADKDALSRILDADQLKSIGDAQKLQQSLATAFALAVTDTSVPYLKKHKDAQRVEVVLPVLKDRLEATFDREKITRSPVPGSEPVTKYGVMNMSYTVNGAVNQRGLLKKIRSYASQLTAAELGH